MSKQIDIEYCGSWGYGGPSKRVKDYIIKNYGEQVEVNTHSSTGVTGVIKVSWIKNGALQPVWSKGKAETESGHAEILALLKQNAWLRPDWERLSSNEKTFWNLGSSLKHVINQSLNHYKVSLLHKCSKILFELRFS